MFSKSFENIQMVPPRNWDFFISPVGAGSAGSVVASRLSEDKASTVLLLEAGSDGTGIERVPAFVGTLIGTEYDWKYRTHAQNFSCQGFEGKVRQLA